jgi:hypothetical protein
MSTKELAEIIRENPQEDEPENQTKRAKFIQ